ncbi:MAG TPA: glycosyltransferase [Longimicrobiales bacterium]|nr:glycosyltransferase [Longimicrobiales bacterium]
MSGRLLVSIVSWNTRAELARCLTALQRCDRHIEVVVVDNDSSDGSADMVERSFPDVKLIRAGRNLGFAGGNNLAVQDSSAEFVLVLNPDVEVNAAALDELTAFLDHDAPAAAAPLLMGDDGQPQPHMYRRFPTFAQVLLFWTVLGPVTRRIGWLRRAIFEHDLRGDRPVRVDQLPGAALMMNAAALRTVGLMDDGYFVWWEDVDWCYRARNAGVPLTVLPAARFRHAGGASFAGWNTETRVFQFYRAFYRFLARHRLGRLAHRVTPIIRADLALKDGLLRVRNLLGRPHGNGVTSLADTREVVRRMAREVAHGPVPHFRSAGRDRIAGPSLPIAVRDRSRATEPDAGLYRDPDVDVVIVNWNGCAYLPAALAALKRTTVPVRIVVVDNASTDASREYLRSAHPDVEVIALDSNCGYAGGANAGLRHVDGRYALVMNPDVLLAPDCIEMLRDRLDHDDTIGAAQGKLYRIAPEDFIAGYTPAGGTIDSAGHTIRRSRMVVDRAQGEPDAARYDREAAIFSACGAALFLRRSMLDDVAPHGEFFAESFFAYKEDIDLCWRARLLGWDVRYVPAAVAHHVRTAPLDGQAWRRMHITARRHSWKNHYLLMIRNDRVGDIVRALPYVAAWEVARLGHAVLRDPRVLRAFADLARALPGALRERRDLLRRRRATPAAVRCWFGAEPVPVRVPERPAELPRSAVCG